MPPGGFSMNFEIVVICHQQSNRNETAMVVGTVEDLFQGDFLQSAKQ